METDSSSQPQPPEEDRALAIIRKALRENEAGAAKARRNLKRIYGSGARADDFVCWLMQTVRDLHSNLPPEEQNPQALRHLMEIAAFLIQRK